MRNLLSKFADWLISLPDLRSYTAYGVGRSALACGFLLTRLATPDSLLFFRTTRNPTGLECENGGLSSLLIGCGGAPSRIGGAVTIGILLLVISGWRPRITAIPFWWVVASQALTITMADGGDHLTLSVVTLMIPLGLADSRRWIWVTEKPQGRTVDRLLFATGFFALCLQEFVVYAHASIGKLASEEWRDGTALWYISRRTEFGFPNWLLWLTNRIFATGYGVAGMTYGTLVIELIIAVGALCFFAKRFRTFCFVLVVLLHVSIAITMGLASFAFATIGLACIVFGPAVESLLIERAQQPDWTRRLAFGRSRTGEAQLPEVRVSASAYHEEQPATGLLRMTTSFFAIASAIVFGLIGLAAVFARMLPDYERLRLVAVLVLLGVVVPILLWRLRLRFDVDENGVRIRMFPLVNETIPMSRIDRVAVVEVDARSEFGGFGARGGKRSRLYGMEGHEALRIASNGREFTLLLSAPEDAAALLRTVAAK